MTDSNNTITVNGVDFKAVAAITPLEQSYGLMYHKWPPPVMFFPYKDASVRKFWMKNTVSPLDIVFCRDNKIISIVAGDPLSTAMIGPNEPCDLVVEFPKGTVEENNFCIGDTVSFKYSASNAAKFLLE